MNGLRLFQEPSVQHLTGVNQPNVILVLIPGGSPEEILFLPAKNPAKEFWDGVRLGVPTAGTDSSDTSLAEARLLTGIETIRPMDEFQGWLEGFLKRNRCKKAYAFYHEYGKGKQRLRTQSDANWEFRSRLLKTARKIRPEFDLESCAELHFRLRLPLEVDQVKDVDQAVDITRQAFEETMAAFSTFENENELAAHLEWGMRRRSPFGLSFPSIVASGRNATVLHYLKNDEPIDKQGLVLMDFGARWGTMHADITRTVPASGRYNPLQELLYRIVLEALQRGHSASKPGTTVRTVNDATWEFIEGALQDRFLSKGGKMERAYSQKPHGVSHLMGEQEHDGDPHRLYQDLPMQVGWQLSNEPGLYGRFIWKVGGRRYDEWIGIRIEDDMLITSTGSRNLSESITRDPQAIETLMTAPTA
jgi:Xaa-Pro aminopeptidase